MNAYRKLAIEVVRQAVQQANGRRLDNHGNRSRQKDEARRWLSNPKDSARWVELATHLDYDTVVSQLRHNGTLHAA